MDYIQQAIDKARAQREGSDAAAITTSRAEPPRNTPGRIAYTQTRTVTPSPAHLARERVIAGFADDRRAESYRQLRTQVLHKFRENGWRTLAVTSPNPGAGKTLTALNLAISLSLEVNQTVLLVDLDLRHSSVMHKLGIDAEFGLVDYLEGRAELSDALINPGLDRLVILPNNAHGRHRSELLSSPQMAALMKDLVGRYESRLIIFDLPALLDDDDAMVFTPYVDATLLVVEDFVSTRSDIERSLRLLEGTPLIGTVLNKVR